VAGVGGGAWGDVALNSRSNSTPDNLNHVPYDLCNQLDLFFGDDNDENVFKNDISKFQYYDSYMFNDIPDCKNCVMLSILCVA
jgi:hypothetical protein